MAPRRRAPKRPAMIETLDEVRAELCAPGDHHDLIRRMSDEALDELWWSDEEHGADWVLAQLDALTEISARSNKHRPRPL